jgi:starch synthase (maltosyl-transferring)
MTPPAAPPSNPAAPAALEGTASSAVPAHEPAPARVVVSDVRPTVDAGRFPVKRVLGDVLTVSATVCADGHDELRAQVLHRSGSGPWAAVPMVRLPTGRWEADVELLDLGTHQIAVEAWVDEVATWERTIARKRAAGQPTDLDERSLAEATGRSRRRHLVSSPATRVLVERPLAGCSAWYEFFPRSTVDGALRHATLREAVDRLPYVADLGFDVVYLPPIHPIGHTHRKGPDNSLVAGPDDVGSPWAIGDESGGHDAVHPQLGTVDDVRTLAAAARDHGLELALDLAFQCSPDHPWVRTHPEWFTVRADGSIAHAENPPKRYDDIVPLNFDSDDWPGLWQALADVVRHWRAQGVRVFRVDNPHTKPFAFWEWLIAEMQREDPEVVFLAEAFAAPPVMMHLAKVGFTQSYTHFPWQHTPWQLRDYVTMLTTGEPAEYLRSNSWPQTPDILTDELQQGVKSAFVTRLVLAATLSASYGIYGPAFETMASEPRPGAEEYGRNEKYELRSWDLARARLLPEIAAVNRIRRRMRALHHDRTLRFHHCDNERIVVYSKTAPRRVLGVGDAPSEGLCDDPVLVVANTDHWATQSGTVRLDLTALDPGGHGGDHQGWDDYDVVDLFGGGRYRWRGADNVVILTPDAPVHVFQLQQVSR